MVPSLLIVFTTPSLATDDPIISITFSSTPLSSKYNGLVRSIGLDVFGIDN